MSGGGDWHESLFKPEKGDSLGDGSWGRESDEPESAPVGDGYDGPVARTQRQLGEFDRAEANARRAFELRRGVREFDSAPNVAQSRPGDPHVDISIRRVPRFHGPPRPRA